MDQGVEDKRRRRQGSQFIKNDSNRKLTFHRRKASLVKKARELSILCGIDTCVIIYGTPSITETPEVPETWPPNLSEVQQIVCRYHQDSQDSKKRKPSVVRLRDYIMAKRVKIDSEHDRSPASDGELIANSSEKQLQSLLSLLGNKIQFAKEQLAVMKATEKADRENSTSHIAVPTGTGFDSQQVTDMDNGLNSTVDNVPSTWVWSNSTLEYHDHGQNQLSTSFSTASDMVGHNSFYDYQHSRFPLLHSCNNTNTYSNSSSVVWGYPVSNFTWQDPVTEHQHYGYVQTSQPLATASHLVDSNSFCQWNPPSTADLYAYHDADAMAPASFPTLSCSISATEAYANADSIVNSDELDVYYPF